MNTNFYDMAQKIDGRLIETTHKNIEETLTLIQKDISYENYFFKKVNTIEWFIPLKENGHFLPEKAPGHREAEEKGYYKIPFWNVLDYLEKVSQQVNIPGNEKYIGELLTIIRDTTKYHIENGEILDNYYTWWYFVKILCNLPNDKVEDEILDLIPVWLKSKFDNVLPGGEIVKKLLPKFLDSNNPDDWKKAEKIVDFATQIKWIPKYTDERKKEVEEKYKHIFEKPENERTGKEKRTILILDLEAQEPKTIIDTFWLIESFVNQKNAIKIGEKCSDQVIFDLANKLKGIFEKTYLGQKYDHSHIWFRSLFGISGHISSVQERLALILRDILLAKARNDAKATRDVIEKFLSDEYSYPLFKRMILFVIGSEWNKYKDVFWKMLDKDKNTDLFNDLHYEPEVYETLEKNVKSFALGEKEKIKKVIEENVPRKPHPEDSAYQKQKWYSALKTDPFFAPLYEKHKEITKKEEKISFKEPQVYRAGPAQSPLDKERIVTMPNEELAIYLKEFKTSDPWNGPTSEGLAELIKDVAKEKPEKFIDDLESFKDTGFYYVCEIFYGIKDAWKEKKLIDWGKLFRFIENYISRDIFWQDRLKIEDTFREANHEWIIGAVAELIQEGTRDDAWVFSEEYFQISQGILFSILDGLLKEKEKILSEQPVRDNFVVYALNSSFGKTTEALFLLALRIKRVEEKTKNEQVVNWEKNIKRKYEELLQNDIVEGYVWLGQYSPNFYYLDKNWTEEKIRTIVSKKGHFWEAFMNGYLSGSRVYDELYKLMREDYLKAIDYEFKDKNVKGRLVQHICIGYLRSIEVIENTNSLFRLLLDKWNPSQIQEIIGFFWMQRDYLVEKIEEKGEIQETQETIEIKNKINELWRWVYENKYKGKQELNEEDKKILSGLSELTGFLCEINEENFEWLKLSARYVDIDFRSSFFIEYLDGLKDKGASWKYVGKIYEEILKNSTPEFKQENIISIVEFLFQKGDEKIKKQAEKICIIYGQRGFEFLRKIYEKYNNQRNI